MKIPTLGPGSTLIVDSSGSASRQWSRWLSRAGHRVEVAKSAEECMGVLGRSLPDLIVLDLGLADPGRDLLAAVKQHHTSVPVVVVAENTAVEEAVAAMQGGAYDYLVRPLDEHRFMTAAKNAIAFGRMSTRVVSLEREVKGLGYAGLVGQSRAMKALYRKLDRIAASDVTVLIQGESGTGKELIARSIHQHSSRRDGPFLAINCAAVPESLQESELFGHEKGAFTGATSRHPGKFEQADGGILFFDEIGELSPGLQAKLLRVIQERTFQRVGGTKWLTVDVRVVAATHRILADEVEAGRFRDDLFYRLAVLELMAAPLRERDGDVALLATLFLEEYDAVAGGERSFAVEALQAMGRYHWPGNVRELQNAVQRAAVLADGDVIHISDLPPRILAGVTPVSEGKAEMDLEEPAESAPNPTHSMSPLAPVIPPGITMSELERLAVEGAFGRAGGNISSVARELNMSRGTVYRKLREYGLS